MQVMWCHEAAVTRIEDSGKSGWLQRQSWDPSGCSVHPWFARLAWLQVHQRSSSWWLQSHQWLWGTPWVPALVCLQFFRESHWFWCFLLVKWNLILILMQSVLLGNAKLRAVSTVSSGIHPRGFLCNNKDKVIIYYSKAMNTPFLNNRTAQHECALHGQMFTYLFGINTFLTGFPQGTMMGSLS